MRSIQKLVFSNKRTLTFGVFLVLALLPGTVIFNSDVAYADPPDTVALQKYCKSKISGKADEGCTAKNMGRIQDAVTDDCKDEKKVQACVADASNALIDQIAKKDPKNTGDFNDAFSTVIDNKDADNKDKADKKDKCVGSECTNTPTGQGKNCDSDQCDLVALYINPAINLLSVMVGLVIATSLIMAGIQYTTSSGDPQKTGAAKTRITNTLLAFFAYAFFYAFLNFLIPGGLFK